MAEGYDLVLAFPDQSPEFAHGFTCGRIWQKMLEAPARDVQETVLAECPPTIEAMAMAKGWVEEIKDIGDGWLDVRLRTPLPAESATH
jgi:hypothetical protein